MAPAISLDHEAIAELCSAHNVARLRLFGSALSERFDPDRSDVDFLVDFDAQTGDVFEAYFGLKRDLESLLGRPVDLVMTRALTNPYLAKSILASAKDLYDDAGSSTLL